MATLKGADWAWWEPTIAQLNALGIRFASRYLSWLPNGKVITRAEFNALRAAGIGVVLNWEFSAQDMKRGRNGGLVDAREALRQAGTLGVAHPVIYHSADWDASRADYLNYIKPYMQAVVSVYGGPQFAGIYGSYNVVRWALQDGLVKYGWQTYAWSRGQWYVPPGHVRQTQNGLGGGNYDLDFAYAADFGQIGGQAVPDGEPTPLGVYGRTRMIPKPVEEAVQLELGKPIVLANPGLASGYQQWVSFTSDFADAEVRFAYFDTGWHLVGAPTANSDGEPRLVVSAAGGDVSWLADSTKVRKFSILLRQVSAENAIVGVDILPTPIPAK